MVFVSKLSCPYTLNSYTFLRQVTPLPGKNKEYIFFIELVFQVWNKPVFLRFFYYFYFTI